VKPIVVATYNILADVYIRPEYYPNCDPADFVAAVRHPRLEARVAGLGADIVMLQEVEHATFTRLDKRLRESGYVGRWAHKWSGKPDGCATFVRAPLQVAYWLTHDLHEGGAKPSGHIALSAHVVRDGRAWTFVNTHLKFHLPDATADARVGLLQARHLLSVLGKPPRTVIGGDLNAEPDSDVLDAFRGPGYADAHPASNLTFVLEARPRKIDYLLHTGDLRAVSRPPPALTPASALPSKDEPSDHLPLIAAFAPPS
jgi:endonuclease/exonuclease/phosphatase family metal-dependent hydrolase